MVDHSSWLRDGLIGTVILLGLLAGAEAYLGGVPALTQFGLSLALPLGLVWVGLLILSVGLWSIRTAGSALLATALLVLLTVAGNHKAATALIGVLEAPYVSARQVDDAAEPENEREQRPLDTAEVSVAAEQTPTNPQLPSDRFSNLSDDSAAGNDNVAGSGAESGVGSGTQDRREDDGDDAVAELSSPPDTFDVLVLLSGSASERADGTGGCLLEAARQYHQGRARQIHCTGELSQRAAGAGRSVAEIRRDLLIELGVPSEAITTGPGATLAQQIAALAELRGAEPDDTELGENAEGDPDGLAANEPNGPVEANEPSVPMQPDTAIGIVAPAWQMARVQKLADANDLSIVPVPADFRSVLPLPPGGTTLALVPNAEALVTTTTAVGAYLSSIVFR